MALGAVRNLRSLADSGEAASYQEHLTAEYALARLAHGAADGLPAEAHLDALRAFAAN